MILNIQHKYFSNLNITYFAGLWIEKIYVGLVDREDVAANTELEISQNKILTAIIPGKQTELNRTRNTSKRLKKWQN